MAEMMASGVELMLVGMGIVYLFLAMLVVAINVMSYCVQRFFPEPPPIISSNAPNPGMAVDKATVAAITAAIQQYRKDQL